MVLEQHSLIGCHILPSWLHLGVADVIIIRLVRDIMKLVCCELH